MSQLPANLDRLGVAALVLGSVFTAPLLTVATLTLTGDRLLGLLALGAVAGLGVARRLRWTAVHSGLALFVGAQVLTTIVNASRWPQGLKFVTIYVLGFACFCLAAELARRPEERRAFVTWWIAVGAGLGAVATALSAWANPSQHLMWGTAIVQRLALDPGPRRLVLAPMVTFNEPNLLSSFLLIPFALALWLWPSRTRWGIAGLAALVFGLTFGFTRAVWIAMAGIVAFWCWRERPPWRRVAALGALLLLAFLLHAAVVGVSVLKGRLVDPIETGRDTNLRGRREINRATIDSWLTRPLVGHGAGSINRLSLAGPSGRRSDKPWNGNLVLFVLHDSGLVGLGALLWLSGVVCRRGIRAIRGAPAGSSTPLGIPLLAIGGGLCFAYQFTHALWLMYPYVFLGFLAAVTDEPAVLRPLSAERPRG